MGVYKRKEWDFDCLLVEINELSELLQEQKLIIKRQKRDLRIYKKVIKKLSKGSDQIIIIDETC